MQKAWHIFKNNVVSIANVFREDDSFFRFTTTMKMTAIPALSLLIFYAFLWFLLRINLIFFEANGYMGIAELREAYFDYVFSFAGEFFLYLIGFFICNAIVGIYLSNLLLRPFKILADHCERITKGEHSIYGPDYFTELKLLRDFAEYFFNWIDNCFKSQEKKLRPVAVLPSQFTGIHRPTVERSFFIQYSLFWLTTILITAVAIYAITIDAHSNVVQLSIRTLPQSKVLNYFLAEQRLLLTAIVWAVIAVHSLLSMWLALNLYSKVSSPAFAIFATLRSFVKGNFSSRIHLVGYYYLRTHSRKINKYLDYLQGAC